MTKRLPVYARIGEGGTEHRIGEVSTDRPGLVYRAVAELLGAVGLILVERGAEQDAEQEEQ
jgi:hypothetical protein